MAQHPGAPFNAQIAEEAAEWFVEFRTGDVDDAGRRAFDSWVRRSQEHLRAYLEYAAIWNESGALDPEHRLDVCALIELARSSDNIVHLGLEDAAVERAPGPEGHRRALPSGLQKSTRRTSRWAIAASIACLALGSAMVYWFQARGIDTYATAVGEQRSIRLSDGSTVEINSRSRLRVDFSEAQRTVELLEGQALFEVAKDARRPFVVRSGDANVRAVGTQFDVYKKAIGTVVTVVEGQVAVNTAGSSGTNAPTLSAGERLTVAPRSQPIPERVDVAAATAWRQRQLVFDSVPLAEVAEEFNRYSARPLRVEEGVGSELQLSGVFTTDPEFLIRYLRERSDVAVFETTDEIRIVRRR